MLSEIRARSVGSNGGGEGAEEERRRRGEDDATTKGEGVIWRCRVRDARETKVVSTLGKPGAPDISVAKPLRSQIRGLQSLRSHAETVEHLADVRAHVPRISGPGSDRVSAGSIPAYSWKLRARAGKEGFRLRMRRRISEVP